MCFSEATGFSQIRFSVYSYKRPDPSRISAQPLTSFDLISSSLGWAFLFGCLLLPIPVSLPNFPTSSLSQSLRNDSSLWYSHLIINKPFPSILHFIFSPFCLITFHPPHLALWISHWIYCKCNPLVLLPQFLPSEIHNALYHMIHWKLCLDYIFESVHCFIYKR